MEFAPPPIIHEVEVMIEEPVNAAPHSISSGSGHLAGLNHSSTSLAAVARLANLAEEAASVNHPDSRNPDADAAEAVCATPMEEVGAESQSQPSDDPVLLALVPVTGPSSKKPRSGGEVEMATEAPAVPVVVPAEVASGEAHPAVNVEAPHPERKSPSAASSGGGPVNDASCSSDNSFSYAELEDKLKEIPPGSPDIMLQPRCSKMWKWIFASRHKESENQLRLKLEEAEAGLSTIRKENEALRVDLAEAKSREELAVDRLHEAADEIGPAKGGGEATPDRSLY
ncbi:hypothetical protein CK203_084350 [Vitis vinifera]|uniref:Uncharacterized protein n=1 Tax=Vitis vinifera TaxID=29760 RepID=A0A438DF81_VITVI|nr:hypothetical protein CK203_084350 [Vitis vinifera]